jgi:hypothetical protein
MPKFIPERELQAIRTAVPIAPATVTTQQIADSLSGAIPIRTLQYRLRHLVACGQLEREGEGRWVRYRQPASHSGMDGEFSNGASLPSASDRHAAIPGAEHEPDAQSAEPYADLLSPRGSALRTFLRQRPAPRRPAGARRRLLDTYRPNATAYLPRRDRLRLAELGALATQSQLAGTEARRLGEALELDLAWNAARLTGIPYGRLEARALLKFDRPAAGHDLVAAQAVLNHRDALRFLLGDPEAARIDRATLCNLHAIVAHNLLPDETAAGRIRAVDERFRHTGHGSGRALVKPTVAPSGPAMQATFERMIDLAQAITDPFEQALFLWVQLPYLAPFEAMNDRVALLAVNLPLIRHNLAPLAFVDVPPDLYRDAVRGVVERSRVELLRDVFVWAYERSARHYGAGRLAADAPDPFRLAHAAALRAAVGELVRTQVPPLRVAAWLEAWTETLSVGRVPVVARDRFKRLVYAELRGLRESNYARYPITAAEFRAWQTAWSASTALHH